MAVTEAEQGERLKRNEEKVLESHLKAGWTVLPSIILEKQHALDLNPIGVNILLQLARYWVVQRQPHTHRGFYCPVSQHRDEHRSPPQSRRRG